MTPDEEDPTEEERQEAEALARALDRGNVAGGAPEDALGAAALLRWAQDGGALAPARSDAILEEALASARPRRARAPTRTRLFAFLGLAAAMAATVVVALDRPDLSAALPPPPRGLLEAELAALDAPGGDLAAIGREMTPYRVAMYDALHTRYGR